jgi:hypothetical protein
MHWLHVLYRLLDRLAPEHVANPEKIDHVLARWATLDDRMSGGKVSEGEGYWDKVANQIASDRKPLEGYHTSLSLKDEFRCLIAALYGRGTSKPTAEDLRNKDWRLRSFIHGSPNAKDVALRCAYYGKGEITPQEVKAGYKRDEKAFVFAVLFNDKIYEDSALRKLLQEEYWDGMFDRYTRKKRERERRKKQEREARSGPDDPVDDLANESEDVELASHQSGAQKAFGFVGYAWLVITNLFYLAIVAFVLSRTSELDPKLTIVIATLGLIYVTVRGIGMGQFLAFAPSLIGIAKSLDELKGRSGERLMTGEDYVRAEMQLKRGQIKFYIQSLFLSLTSLICLFFIYTALT